jgi:hypothetical protein
MREQNDKVINNNVFGGASITGRNFVDAQMIKYRKDSK